MKLHRLLPALLLVSFPVQAQSEAPQRYVRVEAKETRAATLPDEQANEVVKLRQGTLVAVYRDTGNWLEIEVPGGFAVWIFGRYLKQTDVLDVHRVNGNGVNLRPRPTAEVANYPLGQHLYAGDRVRVIERADDSLPLAQDWVRVWTPPGVRAWIPKGDTRPLAAGGASVDGKAAWEQALANLPPAPARAKSAREAAHRVEQAGAAAASEAAEAAKRFDLALEAAWTLLDGERERDTPDWPTVRAGFIEAGKLAPAGAGAAQVAQALKTLTALEEASALRAELQTERKKRAQEALRRQRAIWERSRAKDPLGQAFLSRGALECVSSADGVSRYYLHFGGEVASEIVCVSGRYDLDLFAGYEVGVKGMELIAPDGVPASPRRVEVTKLEILARRP